MQKSELKVGRMRTFITDWRAWIIFKSRESVGKREAYLE